MGDKSQDKSLNGTGKLLNGRDKSQLIHKINHWSQGCVKSWHDPFQGGDSHRRDPSPTRPTRVRRDCQRAVPPPPRPPQFGAPDLCFTLAPITFSWGGVVWEGVSETARGVVGWGKGARTFAMSPIAASYSGVLSARHLSPCSDLCIVREFGAARGHPVGRAYHSMTPSHRIHNVLSVYISALSLNCTSKFEIAIMWFTWSNLT